MHTQKEKQAVTPASPKIKQIVNSLYSAFANIASRPEEISPEGSLNPYNPRKGQYRNVRPKTKQTYKTLPLVARSLYRTSANKPSRKDWVATIEELDTKVTAALNVRKLVASLSAFQNTPVPSAQWLKTPLTYQVAIDQNFRNKAIGKEQLQTVKNLREVNGTIGSMLETLSAGLLVLPAELESAVTYNARDEHFLAASLLAPLDVDGKPDGTYFQPSAINRMCRLLGLAWQFTASSDPEKGIFKYRILVPLCGSIQNSKRYRNKNITAGKINAKQRAELITAINAIVLQYLGGSSDAAMRKPTQVIYGNNNPTPYTVDGETLPMSAWRLPEMMRPIHMGRLLNRWRTLNWSENRMSLQRRTVQRIVQSQQKVDVNILIANVTAYLKAKHWDQGRVPGSGQYNDMHTLLSGLATFIDYEAIAPAFEETGWVATGLNDGQTLAEFWEAATTRTVAREQAGLAIVTIGTVINMLKVTLQRKFKPFTDGPRPLPAPEAGAHPFWYSTQKFEHVGENRFTPVPDTDPFKAHLDTITDTIRELEAKAKATDEAATHQKYTLLGTDTGGGKTTTIVRAQPEDFRLADGTVPSGLIFVAPSHSKLQPAIEAGWFEVRGRHGTQVKNKDNEYHAMDFSPELTEQLLHGLTNFNSNIRLANSHNAKAIQHMYEIRMLPRLIHATLHGAVGHKKETKYTEPIAQLKEESHVCMTVDMYLTLAAQSKIPDDRVVIFDETNKIEKTNTFSTTTHQLQIQLQLIDWHLEKYTDDEHTPSLKKLSRATRVLATLLDLFDPARKEYHPTNEDLVAWLKTKGFSLPLLSHLAEYTCDEGHYQTAVNRWNHKQLSTIDRRLMHQEFTQTGDHPAFQLLAGHGLGEIYERLLAMFKGDYSGGTIIASPTALSLVVPNLRWRYAFDNALRVIFMDATGTREALHRTLGLGKPSDMLYLKAIEPKLTNLTITSHIVPNCVGNRRDAKTNQFIAETMVGLGIDGLIDHKLALAPMVSTYNQISPCKIKHSGHWGGESRGSNKFMRENVTRLAMVAPIIPNVGAITAQLTAELGRIPTADAVRDRLDQITAIETQQGIGRLRANRRAAEQLEVHIFFNRPIAWATEWIDHGIGDEVDHQIDQLTEIAEHYHSGKRTQAAIAEAMGLDQSTISRILARNACNQLWQFVAEFPEFFEPLTQLKPQGASSGIQEFFNQHLEHVVPEDFGVDQYLDFIVALLNEVDDEDLPVTYHVSGAPKRLLVLWELAQMWTDASDEYPGSYAADAILSTYHYRQELNKQPA